MSVRATTHVFINNNLNSWRSGIFFLRVCVCNLGFLCTAKAVTSHPLRETSSNETEAEHEGDEDGRGDADEHNHAHFGILGVHCYTPFRYRSNEEAGCKCQWIRQEEEEEKKRRGWEKRRCTL
jgi:hypothetical protein